MSNKYSITCYSQATEKRMGSWADGTQTVACKLRTLATRLPCQPLISLFKIVFSCLFVYKEERKGNHIWINPSKWLNSHGWARVLPGTATPSGSPMKAHPNSHHPLLPWELQQKLGHWGSSPCSCVECRQCGQQLDLLYRNAPLFTRIPWSFLMTFVLSNMKPFHMCTSGVTS